MTTTPLDFSISTLLDNIAAIADLPPELRKIAEDEYTEIGEHLATTQARGWDVYPQGSMLIGTVVRPFGATGFDLDMVCLRSISKTSITQSNLKREVGEVLHGYVNLASTRPVGLTPSRRCWIVDYPDEGSNGDLHIDVLPAIPDEEVESPTAILLTDKALHEWQRSNPKAFAEWFMKETEGKRHLIKAAMTERRGGTVDDIPDWEAPTVLQRVVQVLKLHRSSYFADKDPDLVPPSILITTLATRAYLGDDFLADAVVNCVEGMPKHIERRDGKYVVASPVSTENFADKWSDYPERRDAFDAWLEQLKRDLGEASESVGMDQTVARLSKSFESNLVKDAAIRMGSTIHEARVAGKLPYASATGLGIAATAPPVSDHKFYGAP
jgi:hypothetical protein